MGATRREKNRKFRKDCGERGAIYDDEFTGLVLVLFSPEFDGNIQVLIHAPFFLMLLVPF